MPQVFVIGEMWNAPDKVGRFHTVPFPVEHGASCSQGSTIGWCAPYAARVGAFGRGPSLRRLTQTGLCWDRSANLLPPLVRWDAEAAANMVRPLLGELGDGCFVMCGRRTHEACRKVFGTTPELFGMFKFGAVRLYFWPHPSGLCRLWNDPTTMERAQAQASEICGLINN